MSKFTTLYSSYGQSVWLDYIDRNLLVNGGLRELVSAGVRGVTSNPTIFHKAISEGALYDDSIRDLMQDVVHTLGLDLRDGSLDVLPQALGQGLTGGEVVVAGFGGDGEAGRDRQAGLGHLGEAGALAAEQIAHGAVALGITGAEGIDISLGSDLGTSGSRHRERNLWMWAGGHGMPRVGI